MDYCEPLGQALLSRELLSTDQLRIALLEQGRHYRPLGKILIALGFISEPELCRTLSETHGTPSIDLASALIEPGALALIPRDLARRVSVMPIAYDPVEHRLQLAVADLNDPLGLDRVRPRLPAGTEIVPLLAGESAIERAIDRHYGHELSIDDILLELEGGEIAWSGPSTAGGTEGQPVIRLIDALLADAVKRGASDLHFEPEAAFLRIRYRIDGMLRQIRALHISCWPAMTVRLKVMAGMNIAETRAPQDGHISLGVGGHPIDLRVASQPTLHGENLVLRILDRQKGIVPLEALGLADDRLHLLKRMIARPEGIILVTGPTGSGKTTTLYSILKHINREGIHIMTLEDPVEYPMPLVRQTSVGDSAKLDFANGIRSMMRQDPDVILVGEIRDGETAAMAFRAAMTGHQVYSTLHANSALGAIPRLLDIGVRHEILAGNLIGIVAQRLVRRLCPHCRQADAASPAERRLLAATAPTEALTLYRPGGCRECDFTGYRGRLAIMELLRIDREIDALIAARATVPEIQVHAQRQGFRSLADDGLHQVLAGLTSLDELARVVDLSERM